MLFDSPGCLSVTEERRQRRPWKVPDPWALRWEDGVRSADAERRRDHGVHRTPVPHNITDSANQSTLK